MNLLEAWRTLKGKWCFRLDNLLSRQNIPSNQTRLISNAPVILHKGSCSWTLHMRKYFDGMFWCLISTNARISRRVQKPFGGFYCLEETFILYQVTRAPLSHIKLWNEIIYHIQKGSWKGKRGSFCPQCNAIIAGTVIVKVTYGGQVLYLRIVDCFGAISASYRYYT